MASGAKRKTTFAKMARESKLRERRAEKAAKKAERKRAAAAPPEFLGETPTETQPEPEFLTESPTAPSDR